ncbi:hypothetical protein SAMN05216359_101286 [Roseateles sp. YR242]|uniref:hypothetical protein n=1 Tax=Roseateles sp. YR242 TaxID=1855305 RepID=UPI0008AE57A5|nr:hypothetical protein [Roseateles sp. YR242]SEK28289.1 hypothetical protein SAMN05216359_101286 [Roseateles sp. YR242]
MKTSTSGPLQARRDRAVASNEDERPKTVGRTVETHEQLQTGIDKSARMQGQQQVMQAMGCLAPMPPAQRFVDVEDPATWKSVRRADVDELMGYLTPQGGNLTEGQQRWLAEVIEKWGSADNIKIQLLRAQVSRGKAFSIPMGQPNSAAVAILSWLDEQAMPSESVPSSTASPELDLDAEKPVYLASSSGGKSGEPKSLAPLKMTESSINYSKAALNAAPMLGLTAKDLESRKPHTKTTTGSSGTDHQAADGNASSRVTDMIERRIFEKTGAHMSPQDFIKQEEKKQATSVMREEKKAATHQKLMEHGAKEREEYLSWIAVLAPKTWRDRQKKLDNSVRSAPEEKKHQALFEKAEREGWPLTWDESMAKLLQY